MTSLWSVESLQRQMNSLARVVLHNRRPVDLKNWQLGKTCVVLGEEWCFFVNESKQNVKTLKALHEDLYQSQDFLCWFYNPLFSWLLPFIGPLIMFYFDACPPVLFSSSGNRSPPPLKWPPIRAENNPMEFVLLRYIAVNLYIYFYLFSWSLVHRYLMNIEFTHFSHVLFINSLIHYIISK